MGSLTIEVSLEQEVSYTTRTAVMLLIYPSYYNFIKIITWDLFNLFNVFPVSIVPLLLPTVRCRSVRAIPDSATVTRW